MRQYNTTSDKIGQPSNKQPLVRDELYLSLCWIWRQDDDDLL